MGQSVTDSVGPQTSGHFPAQQAVLVFTAPQCQAVQENGTQGSPRTKAAEPGAAPSLPLGWETASLSRGHRLTHALHTRPHAEHCIHTLWCIGVTLVVRQVSRLRLMHDQGHRSQLCPLHVHTARLLSFACTPPVLSPLHLFSISSTEARAKVYHKWPAHPAHPQVCSDGGQAR